jgi:hypothetical protein
MKTTPIFLTAALLAACASPVTVVSSGSARAALAISGAPAGATVVLDGVAAGDAARYDGVAGVLALEPGMHRLEVRNAAAAVYRSEVYLGSGETRTILIDGGAK